MQKQITDLSKALEKSNKELTSLRDSILDKQSADDEQNILINTIQDSVEKNESYSRRNNLIFGNIGKEDQRSCDIIVRDICVNHLSLSTESVSAMNFVRCHYLR